MKEKIEKIKSLSNSFKSNLKEYKSSKYDEANNRVDFIDKFFECLDWDVRNNSNYAENYREVVREDKIIIEGKPKAPDYSFRIGGIRKFFLEAKKPSVNIKEEIEPAFQIRRYGYTAKLPLSILTDFEEFAIYDTRIKPQKNDKASVGRIFYCTFEEYEKNFEFIYNTFSKEAIYKGSFDKYILENRNKKGSSEVDKEFLYLIEEWRESLAKTIAVKNKDLDLFSLNHAVQIIIDRIIFIRIAEDRNIEKYGLLAETQKKQNVYEELNSIFLKAHDKYNSGLFKPEVWIQDLDIDGKVLSIIIKSLYYPDCPYELSVLPIEILGNIYEQFLGKTIRLTATHQAKIEEKEEVRKAGGVYYTPDHIVKYIVQNTIAPKLEQIDLYLHPTFRILDPACGSGSFLVSAYSFLLDKYLESYTNKKKLDKALKNGFIYQISENTFRLSIELKQHILLNHIFGVDIDTQAVEVTKLSLLLKLMEDENSESTDRLFKHSDIKLLPDLNANIKCGNSLIGSDFYSEKDLTLFGKLELREINTFDWPNEFKNVFDSGGFDFVIGNPPYVNVQADDLINYFKKSYIHQDNQYDLYLIFLEKYSKLLRKDGYLGVIISNTWLQSLTMKKIRRHLTTQYQWLRILCLPDKVFKAVVDTHVIIFKKVDSINNKSNLLVETKKKDRIFPLHKIKISDIPNDGRIINVITNPIAQKLFKQIIEKSLSISDISKVYNGVKPFEKGKGKPPQTDKIMEEKPYVSEKFKSSTERVGWSPLLRGSLINRYVSYWNFDSWIQYGEWLAAPRDPKIFQEKIKIAVRQTGDSIIATVVESGIICRDNLHIIIPEKLDIYFILGILNSNLTNFVYSIINPEKGEALAQVKKQHVETLPIPNLVLLNKSENEIKKISTLVKEILFVKKELISAQSESDKKILNQKCQLLENQIESLVYKIYELNPEEIEAIENGV